MVNKAKENIKFVGLQVESASFTVVKTWPTISQKINWITL